MTQISSKNRWIRIREFVQGQALILGGLGLASGLVWVFVHLADAVTDGDTERFDTAVLMVFRNSSDLNDPIGPYWVQEMVRDLTALGSYSLLTLLVAGVVIYLILANMQAAAVMVLSSVVSGSLLSTVLKIGFDRPRPEFSEAARQFTASFPSGHAMLSAVTFLTLGALLARFAPGRRLKIYFMVMAVFLTVLVGMTRLYLGVHFPSDVLAGWCLGAAWASICSAVALWLQSRGKMDEPIADHRPAA